MAIQPTITSCVLVSILKERDEETGVQKFIHCIIQGMLKDVLQLSIKQGNNKIIFQLNAYQDFNFSLITFGGHHSSRIIHNPKLTLTPDA